jgi:hypothetical protein
MMSWLKPISVVLLATGLLPIGLSILAHAQHKPVTLSIAAPARPGLAFQQYMVDLGPIQPTSEVRGYFVFRNQSAGDVTITSVEPSCGCLAPQLEKKTYGPGETGTISLRVLPANEAPGKKEYFVDVRYSDTEPREIRLVFRLTLPEKKLSVRPRALMFYQLGEEATSQRLKVCDTRGMPVVIEGVKSSNPLVTVRYLGGLETDGGLVEHQIEVTAAANCPAGRHQGTISISTADEAFPELRVPFMVEGRQKTAEPGP